MTFFRNLFIGIFFSTCVFAQKSALVTGGAGFLGSYLCEKLLREGYDVICVDNGLTGTQKNIKHLLSHPRFRYKQHDVIFSFDEMICVDEIYNLACPASPVWYQKDPIRTIRTSFFGAYNILELARRCNAKVFQASTSEVYGDPLEHPQKESYWGHVNPIGIRACYDEGKRAAETLFFDYHRKYGVSIKVGRIFNTYGPRMALDDGRVVSNFIVQALNNDPITIYGTGAQTRSFCFVDDLIEAIYLFMQTDDSCIGPINLGNEHEFTILELAEKVIAKTNSQSSVIYLSLPSDDPCKRSPDTTQAEKLLHWRAKIQLDQGLDKTIAYFMNQ